MWNKKRGVTEGNDGSYELVPRAVSITHERTSKATQASQTVVPNGQAPRTS